MYSPLEEIMDLLLETTHHIKIRLTAPTSYKHIGLTALDQ